MKSQTAFLPSVALFPSCGARSRTGPQRPRLRAARARSRAAAMKLGGGGGGDDAPAGKLISTALDIGFRAVWIQLLTAGVSEAYEAAITDFCVACVAARKAGYGVASLKFELAQNEPYSDDPEIMKLALNDKEKSTRMIWVSLVWLTLRRYEFPVGLEEDDDDITSGLGADDSEALARGLNSLVENVCAAADKGYTLSTYKLEQNVSRGPEEEVPSASTLSIQSQWARIVFATIKLLPDALKAEKKRGL